MNTEPAALPRKTVREQELEFCEKQGVLRRPAGYQVTPQNRPSSFFCLYHMDYGHTSDQCYKLRTEIERVKTECPHLRPQLNAISKTTRGPPARPGPYYRKAPQPAIRPAPSPQGPSAPTREVGQSSGTPAVPENAPTRGIINVIAGGPTGGDSNRARKSYARLLETLAVHEERAIQDAPPISFGVEDMLGVLLPHTDALVIRVTLANYEVARVLVDSGSSVNILFQDAFGQMQLGEARLEEVSTPLFGFAGHMVHSAGQISLPLTLGSPGKERTCMTQFLVVDASSAYNIILGRPFLSTFQAVASPYHQKVKFPVGRLVGEVRGEQKAARSCYVEAVRADQKKARTTEDKGKALLHSEVYTLEASHPRKENREEGELVEIASNKFTRVAGDSAVKEELIACLHRNEDVFAGHIQDLTGISPQLAEHHLNVLPGTRPVQQKRRHFGPEKDKVIAEEVRKLLEAGHVKEVQFPEWISNVVLVPKPSGQWRMCIDFRDLNKACPKDCYPLPRIDLLVDSTAGYEMVSLMDAYQGYHQIPLALEDQKRVCFITAGGLYAYVVMPFGLKNAGATYQRLMDQIFNQQKGRNVEVYVDDILVKSRTSQDLISDLEETFATLRKYNMKLNPKKCLFGVRSGKFLGYIVTEEGIQANPEKVEALCNMKSPTNKQETQRLVGRIVSLSRFIARSADKGLPFFKILRKAAPFQWDDQCEKAFQDLKHYLAQLPLLAKPSPNEVLWIYLAVSEGAASSVLLRQEGSQQFPIYYISHILKGAEFRYTELEKLAYILLLTTRKLKPYFLAHPIHVLTNSELGRILTRPGSSGRLAKWAVEMSEYDIQYSPRTSIKAQALADFLAEVPPGPEADPMMESEPVLWKVYVDGSANHEGSGVGILLMSPQGEKTRISIRLDYKASNNEAEYEAILAGLQAARAVGANIVQIHSDSQLAISQLSGLFAVKEARMKKYAEAFDQFKAQFKEVHLQQIPREDNLIADELARLASSLSGWTSRDILCLQAPGAADICNIEDDSGGRPKETVADWRSSISSYLQQGSLPSDPRAARSIKKRAARFLLIEGILYKTSFTRPLLKCLRGDEGMQVLQDIHEGCCGNHLGGRSLARKTLLAGYFWPTLHQDSAQVVRTCKACQIHSNRSSRPAELMKAIVASCPFDQWGMDIVGPMPQAPLQKKFLIVAVDYFSKWVEAEPLAKITEAAVIQFLWRNIVCRFGVPRKIISDNGRQFQGSRIQEWCSELQIEQAFSSVAHPQANGQVEVTNRILIQGLRTRLEAAKGNWVEELPGILWAYRTTPRSATGATPFSLVYGEEAVIPTEVFERSARIQAYDPAANNTLRSMELDLIEERRERARIRAENYKRQVQRAFNKGVKPREFQIGDLVLRKINPAGSPGKLAPKWEGPYQVVRRVSGSAYYLRDAEGQEFWRPWNAMHLRRYY